MLINASQARERMLDIERRFYNRMPAPDGSNVVSDGEEDYVFDALFDIPNR